MSWVSFVKNGYRHTIDSLYDLEHKPLFKIYTGETLYFRDGGSLSLNFMSKNRIKFPYYFFLTECIYILLLVLYLWFAIHPSATQTPCPPPPYIVLLHFMWLWSI